MDSRLPSTTPIHQVLEAAFKYYQIQQEARNHPQLDSFANDLKVKKHITNNQQPPPGLILFEDKLLKLSCKQMRIDSNLSFEHSHSYRHIMEHSLFTCGIFLLKKGHSLPFHNHPQMNVFSRVLMGQLYCKAVDITGFVTSTSHSCIHVLIYNRMTSSGQPVATVAREAIHTRTSAPFQVSPTFGNIHTVHALEDTAFIDVIGPPYSEDRICTYYSSEHSTPHGIILSEICPDLIIEDVPYTGDRFDPSLFTCTEYHT